MGKPEIPYISGDEYDAFCRKVRNIIRFKRGEKKRIQHGYWKRLRKYWKLKLGG